MEHKRNFQEEVKAKVLELEMNVSSKWKAKLVLLTFKHDHNSCKLQPMKRQEDKKIHIISVSNYYHYNSVSEFNVRLRIILVNVSRLGNVFFNENCLPQIFYTIMSMYLHRLFISSYTCYNKVFQ